MATRWVWGLCGALIGICLVGDAVMPSRARAWEPEGPPHVVPHASTRGRHHLAHTGSAGTPRRYYVMPSHRRPRLRVHVHHRPRPEPVVTTQAQKTTYAGPFERDPYDNDGLVVVGAGAGGLVTFGDRSSVAAMYRLNLGLAIEQAEFGLAFGFAPGAMDVPAPSGDSVGASLYTIGAGFNYRFLRDAVVHPVAGAGLEALVLDPSQGAAGTAFGATARAGLEFAYPLTDGALALGIDATGHLPFAATDEYATSADPMLSFGAYVNYRF